MLSAKKVIAVKAKKYRFILIFDFFLSLFVFKNVQRYSFILETGYFGLLKSVKFGLVL